MPLFGVFVPVESGVDVGGSDDGREAEGGSGGDERGGDGEDCSGGDEGGNNDEDLDIEEDGGGNADEGRRGEESCSRDKERKDSCLDITSNTSKGFTEIHLHVSSMKACTWAWVLLRRL